MRASAAASLLSWAALLVFVGSAAAQGHGGGGPGGGGPGGGGGGFGGGFGWGRPSLPSPSHTPAGSNSGRNSGSNPESKAAGLQLAPPGRWWDDTSFAKGLGLNSKQQHRMDSVFSANRDNLLKLYKNLQGEESNLAKTIRAKDLDEGQIFQQIDRVTGARGELEKANVHMLLQIRKEMTVEQADRLDEQLRSQGSTQQQP